MICPKENYGQLSTCTSTWFSLKNNWPTISNLRDTTVYGRASSELQSSSLDNNISSMDAQMPSGALVLEDGTRFPGTIFGFIGDTAGEVGKHLILKIKDAGIVCILKIY